MSVLELPIKADNKRKALDAALQIQAALEILHSLPVRDVLLSEAEMNGQTTLLMFALIQLNLSCSNLLIKMTQELKSSGEKEK